MVFPFHWLHETIFVTGMFQFVLNNMHHTCDKLTVLNLHILPKGSLSFFNDAIDFFVAEVK